MTKEQLKQWGVKYHELWLDKPLFDVLVDDKAINAEDWPDADTLHKPNNQKEGNS
jgi:hypothetical protein